MLTEKLRGEGQSQVVFTMNIAGSTNTSGRSAGNWPI